MAHGDPDGQPQSPHPKRDVLVERVFEEHRGNALIAWALVGVLALVFVESVLDFDVQWIAFVAVISVIVLIPPVVHRDWHVMLPWELLTLALLPVIVRGIFGGTLGIFASYVAVSGIALIVTVELHRYTALEVTHWFAITFVTLATLASVAAWTILRFALDTLFNTQYLTTNDALMREFLWVALAGIAAGIVFDAYFRRRDFALRRVISWAFDL